jgi:hypothetical protein
MPGARVGGAVPPTHWMCTSASGFTSICVVGPCLLVGDLIPGSNISLEGDFLGLH